MSKSEWVNQACSIKRFECPDGVENDYISSTPFRLP